MTTDGGMRNNVGFKRPECKRELITRMGKGLSVRSTECISRQRQSEAGTRRVKKEELRDS